MKQLTCEVCGSTGIIKQEGRFVCQACGCQYSIEEIKKLFTEGTAQETSGITNSISTPTPYINTSKNQAETKKNNKTFKIILPLLLIAIVSIILILFVNNPVANLLEEGKYIDAYINANEKQKLEIRAENAAAVICGIDLYLLDYANYDVSAPLKEAYYCEYANTHDLPSKELVLCTVGNIYIYYYYDGDSWGCVAREDSSSELFNNLYVMELGYKLSNDAIKRINNLFAANKLGEVELIEND